MYPQAVEKRPNFHENFGYSHKTVDNYTREIRGGRSYPLKIMKMWITQSQGVNIRISSGKTVQNLGKQMFLSTRYAPR